jgi:hypothetical protein
MPERIDQQKVDKPRRRLRQSLTTAPVRRLGFMAGQISVPDDFDRMGKEEIEQMFGGGA